MEVVVTGTVSAEKVIANPVVPVPAVHTIYHDSLYATADVVV